MSQEFSRTRNRNLRALSKLDEIPLYPQFRSIPRISRNSNTEDQESHEDRPQSDLRPEVGTSIYRLPQSTKSGPNEASYNHL